MIKVLYAAAESAPFYKTGGLGDVAYALPQALAHEGVDIRVVLPFYARLFPAAYLNQLHDIAQFTVLVGDQSQYVGVKQLQLGAVPVYFIDNESYFGRDHLYGDWDDGGRFGYFQLAIMTMLQVIDFIPDVLHVNDWHTAMLPVLLHDKFGWIQAFQRIKTQLTIHNLQFQGWFPPSILDTVFGIGRQYFNDDGFGQAGQVNFLKGGINFADSLNTVSAQYAAEIQTPEFGERLTGTLRQNAGKLRGILNGLDTTLYDPATDRQLTAHYSAGALAGKALDKQALQRAMHLPCRDVPLFGVVSRLTPQKGMGLLPAALTTLLTQTNAQVVLLGTGDAALTEDLARVRDRFAGQFATEFGFDEALAQQIYAGADFFIMPSAFEPGGLAQLMAMRYGAVPIVHETGGLKDSVQPYDATRNTGTGLSFWSFTSAVLGDMLLLGAALYTTARPAYQALQQRAMAQDFAWSHAAVQYLAAYQALSAHA